MDKRNFPLYFSFIRPYLFRSIVAFILTVPVGMLDAAIAWILRPYMDLMLVEKGDPSLGYGINFFPVLIIAFAVVQSLLTHGSNYLNTWVGQKVSMDVKTALYKKLVYTDPAFFDKASSGEILLRYNQDVDSSCVALLHNAKFFITRIVTSLSLIFVLFYNSWILATIAVLALGIAIYPLTQMKKKMRSLLKDTAGAGMALITNYNETYNGNRVISSYNLQQPLTDKLLGVLRKQFKLAIRMTRRTGYISGFLHFMTSLGIAATIWLQGYLISTGQMTPGNFVSFIAALLLLYNPIKRMGNNINAVNLSFMALERVCNKLREEPKIRNKDNAIRLGSFIREIVYKDVSFSYKPNVPVLKKVNLVIHRGQTVAFVGNSGGGKTTMVNLLSRFYDVNEGSISIDGHDVRDIDLHSLRDLIAVVFQDNFLFTGTIRENILCGKLDATQEEIDAAVDAACLREFIDSLELGLETQIGERGIMLSGGQKQRVAIARAFIKHSPIVILDEATSALDNKSEAVVQEAIDNLMQDKTVLVVAHRLSTVVNADVIVVVNHGVIEEMGTHDELVAKQHGIYANLYRNQLILKQEQQQGEAV